MLDYKKSGKTSIAWITRGGKHIPIFDKEDEISKEQQAKLDTIKNSKTQEYINHYITQNGDLIVDYKIYSIYRRVQFGIRGGWVRTTEYLNYDFEVKKPYSKAKFIKKLKK